MKRIKATPKSYQNDTIALCEMIKTWRKTHNDLRFGQWLWNAMNGAGEWEAPEANALFYIEDKDLADLIKRAYVNDKS